MFFFHSQPSPNIKEACVTFIRWLSSAERCHACARSRTKEMQPAWRCLLICEINLEPVPSTLQNKLGCTPLSVCHNMRFKKLKPCLEFNTDAADNERFGNSSQSQLKLFCLKEKLPHSLSPLTGNIFCQLSSYHFCRWSVSGPPPPTLPLASPPAGSSSGCSLIENKSILRHMRNIMKTLFPSPFFFHPLHLRLTLVI